MSDIHIAMSTCDHPVYRRFTSTPHITLWGFDYTSYKTGETIFVGLSMPYRGRLFACDKVEHVPGESIDAGHCSDLYDELCDWQADIQSDVNSECLV